MHGNLQTTQKSLVARRAELLERQTRVDRDLARRNEPLVADADDQAIQLQNDEALNAIGTAANDEIAAIDAALRRIDLNLYGVCTVCGGAIAKDRLLAVPHATQCASCIGP